MTVSESGAVAFAFVVSVSFLAGLASGTSNPEVATPWDVSSTSEAEARSAPGAAPAFFWENRGQLEPSVRFAKVNTDNESILGARFRIQSIPTLILFKGGSEVARQSGALSASSLVALISAHR